MKKRMMIVFMILAMMVSVVSVGQTESVARSKEYKISVLRKKFDKINSKLSFGKVKKILGQPKKLKYSRNVDGLIITEYRWRYNVKRGYVYIDVYFSNDIYGSKQFLHWTARE